MKPCIKCGGEVVSTIENIPYTGCGFEVILNGVEVRRCRSCGACAPVIRNLAGMHKALVSALVAVSPLIDAHRAFLREFITDVNPAIAGMFEAADRSLGDNGLKALAALAMQELEMRQRCVDAGDHQPVGIVGNHTQGYYRSITPTFVLESGPSQRERETPQQSWHPAFAMAN